MQNKLAKGSPETKINWAKDVDKFESRLSTGLRAMDVGGSAYFTNNDGGVVTSLGNGDGNHETPSHLKQADNGNSGSRQYFDVLKNWVKYHLSKYSNQY